MPPTVPASAAVPRIQFINCSPTPSVPRRPAISTPQYPFSDIYQNSRFADFQIENGGRKVAIEIDDEASLT